MSGNDPPLVVVGTDGTPAAEAAIRYAAQEARRTGAATRLVHVCPDYAPTTPMLPMIRDDFDQVADRILRQGAALAGELAPGCRVTTARRTGPTVATLLALATGATLLVLGRDHRGRWGSVFTGSASTGVAGRAGCPVVSVPREWAERERGQVAVGVRSPGTAAGLLEAGFAAAESRGARLVVVHAWQLPGAYDDVVAARTHPGAPACEVEERLDPLLEEHRARHPAVPVELSVVHQQPAHALLRVAAHSDLLLVLRAAHGLPFLAHLGGTGRTVLHQAPCPVEVVPPVETVARVRVGEQAAHGTEPGARASTL